MKKVVVFLICVSVLVSGCSRGAKQAGILKLVPQDSTFCVIVNDFEQSAASIDKYLEGIAPMPNKVADNVRQPFAMMLGNASLEGVDMTKPFGLFGVMKTDKIPEKDINWDEVLFNGLLIPVTNYKVFAEKSGNVADTGKDGISKIDLGTKILFIKSVGKYAFVSSTVDTTEFLAYAKKLCAGPGLAKDLACADIEHAMNSSIWVYGGMKILDALVTPKLDEGFEVMKAAMTAGVAAGETPADENSVVKMVDFYETLATAFLKQTKSISLGVSVSPEKLSVIPAIAAKPNTAMAKMLQKGTASGEKSKFLKYMEDGAIMNGVMTIDAEGVTDIYLAFYDLLLADSEDQKSADAIKELVAEFMKIMGDECAFSMRNSEKDFFFTVNYYYEINDEAKYNELMDKSVKLMNDGLFKDLYKSFGMEMDFKMARASSEYKGVPIDSFKFNMKMTGMEEEALKMVNAIYGKGFEGRFALVDKILVYSMGDDVDNEIHGLIDSVKDGGPKTIGKETKKALAMTKNSKFDGFFSYNYVRLMQMSANMMSGFTEALGEDVAKEADSMKKAFDIPTESSMVFFMRSGDGRGEMEYIVPKKHILELMGCFQDMTQQKMAAPVQ